MVDRLMTQKTFDFLRRHKTELEEALQSMGQDADSGHQRAAVHDDQATVQLQNQRRAELMRIGSLRDVKIIQPRQETDRVDLGNLVELEYLQDRQTLSASVLPTDDSTYASRTELGVIITPESPLGKAILGQPAGTEIELKTKSPTSPIRVKIRSVKAGKF